MNLLKKIIILVNLILCILCINAFAVSYIWTDGNSYEVNFDNIENYPYYCLIEFSRYAGGSKEEKQNYLIFSTKPITLVSSGSTTGDYLIKNTGSFASVGKTFYTASSYKVPFSGEVNVYKNYNFYTYYFPKDNYFNREFIYSNHDIVNEVTGDVYFESSEGPDLPDDSTIDWESAFEYWQVTTTGKEVYSYLENRYVDLIQLYLKPNNLDGLLDNEELHNNNIYYHFKYKVELILLDRFNNEVRELGPFISDFNVATIVDFPYLIGDIRDFDANTNQNGYETQNILEYLANDDIVLAHLDELGYLNYEINVYPYFEKQNTLSGEYSIVHMYDTIHISHNIMDSNIMNPEDSPIITKPSNIDHNEDITLLIGPDKTILDGRDNSQNYDFDDDFNLIDKNGDIIAIPNFNDNGNFEWVDKEGNIIDTVPIGDNRDNFDKIAEDTLVNTGYDITGIIQGLKADLQALLNEESGINNVFQWFRDVFNWLPFGLLKIFGILIAFFIVFEFIKIIRN